MICQSMPLYAKSCRLLKEKPKRWKLGISQYNLEVKKHDFDTFRLPRQYLLRFWKNRLIVRKQEKWNWLNIGKFTFQFFENKLSGHKWAQRIYFLEKSGMGILNYCRLLWVRIYSRTDSLGIFHIFPIRNALILFSVNRRYATFLPIIKMSQSSSMVIISSYWFNIMISS